MKSKINTKLIIDTFYSISKSLIDGFSFFKWILSQNLKLIFLSANVRESERVKRVRKERGKKVEEHFKKVL